MGASAAHEEIPDRAFASQIGQGALNANADRILFLDHGQVIQAGSHDELIARPGGAYRRFVELQVRGAA